MFSSIQEQLKSFDYRRYDPNVSIFNRIAIPKIYESQSSSFPVRFGGLHNDPIIFSTLSYFSKNQKNYTNNIKQKLRTIQPSPKKENKVREKVESKKKKIFLQKFSTIHVQKPKTNAKHVFTQQQRKFRIGFPPRQTYPQPNHDSKINQDGKHKIFIKTFNRNDYLLNIPSPSSHRKSLTKIEQKLFTGDQKNLVIPKHQENSIKLSTEKESVEDDEKEKPMFMQKQNNNYNRISSKNITFNMEANKVLQEFQQKKSNITEGKSVKIRKMNTGMIHETKSHEIIENKQENQIKKIGILVILTVFFMIIYQIIK